MTKTKDIEGLLNEASIQTNPRVNQAVRDELLDTFSQATQRSHEGQLSTATGRLRVTRIIGPAIAAAIGVACLVTFIHMARPSVAWGQVVSRVEQAKAFMFSLKIAVAASEAQPPASQTQVQWTVYVSEEHGFRMDITAQNGSAPGTVVS